MIRVFIVIVTIWLVLMPPFFTEGACTAEFDKAARVIQDNKPIFGTLASAQAFWNSTGASVQAISAAQCRVSRPRFIDSCGPGDLLYVSVPIKNTICHYYRDSEVRVLFQYDEHGRLRKLQADMKPFKFFSFPWIGMKLYWAK